MGARLPTGHVEAGNGRGVVRGARSCRRGCRPMPLQGGPGIQVSRALDCRQREGDAMLAGSTGISPRGSGARHAASPGRARSSRTRWHTFSESSRTKPRRGRPHRPWSRRSIAFRDGPRRRRGGSGRDRTRTWESSYAGGLEQQPASLHRSAAGGARARCLPARRMT